MTDKEIGRITLKVNVTHTPRTLQRHAEVYTDTPKVGFTQYGELPIIGVLVGIAGGMISLIVMFSLVPVIGSQVDNAMPTIDNSSPWASEDLPSGSGLWTTIGPLLVLCALIAVIMVVLKLLGVF